MSQSVAFWRQALKASSALTVVSTLAAVTLVGCPSGGVGDPCTPEDEYKEDFSGFTLQSAFIESRSFQCQTRLCLVNHFQGRVSCPQGQAKPQECGSGESCPPGETCKLAGAIPASCNPAACPAGGNGPGSDCNDDTGKNQACGGRTCDSETRLCRCKTVSDCTGIGGNDNPVKYTCGGEGYCVATTSVCAPEPNSAEGQKRCYVPGTGTPIAAPVCGQCADDSKRNADQAVYCTCRCAPPKDNPSAEDDNFNFCECPEGFECAEINPNVGLGDAQLAGSYCIKQGTKFTTAEEVQCNNGGSSPAEANCAL